MNIELYKRDFLETVEEFLGEIEDDIVVKFHVFDGNYWTYGMCAPEDVLHLVSDAIHSFESPSSTGFGRALPGRNPVSAEQSPDETALAARQTRSVEHLPACRYNLPTFRVEITMRHATDRFSFILVHSSETEIDHTVIQQLPLAAFKSRLAMFNPTLRKVFDEEFSETPAKIDRSTSP